MTSFLYLALPWVHGLTSVPRDGIGMVGRCSPASRPTNRPTIPAAAIPGDGDDVPAPAGVPGHAATGAHAAAPAGRWGARGAQEGKGEEHRRAWERLGEAARSLREREARVKGEVGGADEGRTEGTGRPQGGEAQAVEELQRAWADLRRRQEVVERAEREGGRQEEGRGREDTLLVPFRQPAIPPEQEGEMQERAWRRIRGEAARLADRDREVAARERRVWEEEEAVARGAHRVLPDPEGDTPSTDVEGRSPSGKRAREEDKEAGQERGKRRRGEERGAGQPQSRADADRLGLGVPTAAAVCAAAGAEGTRDGRRVDRGGRGGAGPLREVGGEEEGKAGEEGTPPLQ